MAQKKVYIGSIGPFLFDDTANINDSSFPGQTVEGAKSNSNVRGTNFVGGVSTTGASGSFTTADSPAKTVTVVNGLITSIV